MKVLQINSKVNVGSVSRITEHIGLLVLENGWESYIAYGRNARKSSSTLLRIGNRFGIYLHYISSLLFDNEGLMSWLATKRFIRQIDIINPDIIHLQNIHGHYLNYPLLFDYLERCNKPVIWTFHDCWGVTGHCSHFELAKCDKWKRACGDCPLKTSYPKSIFLDRSFRNYNKKKQYFTSISRLHIVTVSKWLSDVVGESFLKNIDRCVIYNGVDTDIFKPCTSNLRKELGLNGKIVLLGVATAWSKEKGLDDYAKLSKVLPDNYVIVLVGLKEEQFNDVPDSIIKQTKTFDLRRLAEYYSMADLVLSLSYMETFGLTVAEGLACGTPAIVYDRTASPELVSKETGLVVKAGDIDELKEAILSIAAKGRGYYSANCRRFAIENFDKNKNYNLYIDLYKKVYGS